MLPIAFMIVMMKVSNLIYSFELIVSPFYFSMFPVMPYGSYRKQTWTSQWKLGITFSWVDNKSSVNVLESSHSKVCDFIFSSVGKKWSEVFGILCCWLLIIKPTKPYRRALDKLAPKKEVLESSSRFYKGLLAWETVGSVLTAVKPLQYITSFCCITSFCGINCFLWY